MSRKGRPHRLGIERNLDVLDSLGSFDCASVATLAAHTGRPNRRVLRALRQLEALGLVERAAWRGLPGNGTMWRLAGREAKP